MTQLLSIVDDKIVIEKLSLKYLVGNITHIGSLDINGAFSASQVAEFQQGLRVGGTIEADTIRVKNLITEDATQKDAFTFHAEEEIKLEGKGLIWGVGEDTEFRLVFKTEPRRIYSSENIELRRDGAFQIDGVDVLMRDRLGGTVKKSKLTEVGILDSLAVEGNTNLANTVVVNSHLNRVGINTETGNATLSVVDNGVEVIVGANDGRGIIGTWANQALDIVTDNTTRVSFQGNTVTFGNSLSKNSVVKINGTLEVDSIVTDIRVQRTAPIEFLDDNESSIYGKGLSWIAKKQLAKQFFLQPGPDRFYSTESIDLAVGKDFRIGKELVLSSYELGPSIKDSSLERVGTLQQLEVGGNVNLNDSLLIQENQLIVKRSLTVTANDDTLELTSNSVNASDSFKVKVKDVQELALSEQNLTLGNRNNTTRQVNVYGKVAVNITNPDPEAAFSVDGPVVMFGKKFATGDAYPEHGMWSKGDICWNTNPQESSYVGWICTVSGTPGQWRPFGQIG